MILLLSIITYISIIKIFLIDKKVNMTKGKLITLLSACRNGDNNNALEILKSGNFNFDLRKTNKIKKDGNTALIWACGNKMEEVALYISTHYPYECLSLIHI